MTVQTIIGLKRLDIAKQRLATAFSAADRRALVLEMLAHVVATVRDAAIGPAALATSEPSAPDIAARLGVTLLSDAGLPWNAGLVHALATVDPRPARVLFLAGDVPLVTAAELHQLLTAAPAPGVCIARARDAGTNALVLTPCDAMPPAFGSHRSSEVHAQAAADRGLAAVIVDRPGLALDVDTVEDARDAGLAAR